MNDIRARHMVICDDFTEIFTKIGHCVGSPRTDRLKANDEIHWKVTNVLCRTVRKRLKFINAKEISCTGPCVDRAG